MFIYKIYFSYWVCNYKIIIYFFNIILIKVNGDANLAKIKRVERQKGDIQCEMLFDVFTILTMTVKKKIELFD